MSVRIRYGLKAQISSDPTTEDKDLGNLSYEVVSDGLGEGGARKFTLVAGATDVALAMGNVASATFLMIRTQAKSSLDSPVAVTLKVQRAGPLEDSVSIVPLTTTKEGHFLLSTAGIIGLLASNAGAVNMDLTLAVAGD